MKLFEYAILKHPTSEGKKKGEKTTIIVQPTTVLAPDQNSAAMLAGRAIPEEELGNLDHLEVVLRPF